MATPIERLRRRYPRLLVVLLAATSLLNLATHPFLSVGARPVWRHGGGELAHLIVTDDQTTARRFGIYAELGRVGRGGTLVVPEGSWVDPYVARRVAGITVDERPGTLVAPAEVPPGLPHLGVLELDGRLVRYWVLPGPPSDVFWLGASGGGVVIVPAALVPVPYGAGDG